MSKISSFDLMSGLPIFYDGFCTLRPPTLNSIRVVGFQTYLQYVKTFTLDIDSIVENNEEYGELSDVEKKGCTLYNILTSTPSMKEILYRSLSFFICETIIFDNENQAFLLFKKTKEEDSYCGEINNENFDSLVSGILQVNCLDSPDPKQLKFKNSKQKEKFDKILQGRKIFNKTKQNNENMSLENLIGSISAYHNSYNLLNIWDLTIYQLYDQFNRLNFKTQFDILGLRWAAWGTEAFEFDEWFKDINLKKKDT